MRRSPYRVEPVREGSLVLPGTPRRGSGLPSEPAAKTIHRESSDGGSKRRARSALRPGGESGASTGAWSIPLLARGRPVGTPRIPPPALPERPPANRVPRTGARHGGTRSEGARRVPPSKKQCGRQGDDPPPSARLDERGRLRDRLPECTRAAGNTSG